MTPGSYSVLQRGQCIPSSFGEVASARRRCPRGAPASDPPGWNAPAAGDVNRFDEAAAAGPASRRGRRSGHAALVRLSRRGPGPLLLACRSSTRGERRASRAAARESAAPLPQETADGLARTPLARWRRRCSSPRVTLLPLSVPRRAHAQAAAKSALQERADRFLSLVNASYQAVYTVEQRALWDAATDVSPAHDAAAEAAGKARAAFNGNPALITEAKALLEHRAELDPLTVRQLERVLLNAAEGPMTNPDLVAARIEAETKQASTLNGFTSAGRQADHGERDRRPARDAHRPRRSAGPCGRPRSRSGPALKPGLVKLQGLRNGVARELGYHDYFALQVAGTT